MSDSKQQAEYAISVKDVTKVYKLYEKPIDRLKESVSPTHKNYHRDFYALNGLSFNVKKGETVGIIGTNGSGKSTILKIITGVLTPSTGQVQVNGKISALLELGAGFNMDYTGIENIYMNGTMMGYTKKEMEAKLDDILDFAEIGDFVYQPVKTYSSGMFVRLAFALAINVEPEILIVDEALSVGDVFFQSKCYRRMEEIRQSGTTILMVTHDMGSIIKYCDKVVLLHKGEFISQGTPGHMVDLYKKILAGQMDSLRAQLEQERREEELRGAEGRDEAGSRSSQPGTGGAAVTPGGDPDAQMSDFSGGMDLSGGGKPLLMKDQLTINYDRTEYGDGRAEIYDLGLLDERGNITNLLLKGEMFTIRERIRFNAEIQAPIFTFTIKDKMGTELTGTNTMFEGADIKPVKPGDAYTVEFTQKMTLQGGEYLLSMSCTGFEQGEHVVYHRLYNITNVTVISNKNTVGVYDMESQVKAVKEPYRAQSEPTK
ncbi:ABC transporter ATP-binding protein [Clostridium sp. AF18-27]|uniref:ABC transporter ATP-binding protein n=1 Tax=Enterocloster lavalensis TaxID=460384 RepID=UPI000E52186D|nr:ABC transporter ATP-binding protein [Enterocloster lavalensis]RHR47700.1 ABC transporter ATP-binding protein [Clostridium sp. AF18-27]